MKLLNNVHDPSQCGIIAKTFSFFTNIFTNIKINIQCYEHYNEHSVHYNKILTLYPVNKTKKMILAFLNIESEMHYFQWNMPVVTIAIVGLPC